MCEAEPFCQRVLRRRFPGVPLIEDVRDLRGGRFLGLVDVLVGGFPCQDISSAGKGAGIKGVRSGLWKEFFRVIRELRPKMVLIENVAMLKSRGLDTVLCDLWSIGYHAEWDVISAAAVGAPHLRERIWIVARPAELAQQPVYGEPARNRKGEVKTFSLVGKLPRAGRMGEELHELVPLAPRKTKRKDGWSYWTGVNLFADPAESRLWGTPSAHPRTFTPRKVDHGNQLANQVALLPTSQAADGQGGRIDTVETVLSGRRPSGAKASISLREAITYKSMDSPMWPTPDASVSQDGERTETWFARRERLKITANNGNGAGIPLTIAALADAEGKRMWPTAHGMCVPNDRHAGPSGNELGNAVNREAASRIEGAIDLLPGPLRPRRDGVVEVVGSSRIRESLGLSAAPVAKPGSGSGPLFPTPSAVSGEQGPGRSGREGGDNLVTRVNGSLNPTWVSWLMGMPLWWTDPTVPTEFTTLVGWDQEPLHVAPRVAKSIPLRAPQLRATGNSVVWQCAFYALSRALVATPEIGYEEGSLAIAA